eukprot:TRINITY_DN3158_c0_g1_i1.p1 TRINITY_DN3158_c0_g1~~TRINITY_DN3158_c0_g1_i1.p1  ORF type:complete len:272 (+),score=21.86 TRINITY_DN3158_c0_g1_i1:405-1220(+)
MSNGKAWRKCLYENYGYPDNYTPPESFLAALQKNKDLKLYTKKECLQGGAVVGREFSIVLTFCSLYLYLREGIIECDQLIISLSIVLCIGYLQYLRKVYLAALISGGKMTVLFLAVGYAVSPILYKLTDTISTDTIHLMSAAGFLLHLLTMDYGIPGPIVSRSVALNSGIFSTVCLASRLESHVAAFALLYLAVFCFVLVPMWSEVYNPNPIKSLFTALVSVCMLAKVMPSQAVLAAILLAFIQFVIPLWFHKLQSFKQTIHGPWDEAVLH